jgi:glycosyltransferase involved in cell wall biosynthesis
MIIPGLISVIIPCFNARQYVATTLNSVFAQRGVDFEVVLVDDGSDDGSADLVASHFPSVALYRTPNRGPSTARNYGTERSAGEFIQYLDADDLIAPGKLKKQLFALQHSGADVAYGDWQKFSSLPDGGKVIEQRFERQLGPFPEIDLFRGFWCPTAAYLVRRHVVDNVGGWNPSLPVIQDARFMLDCALHGSRFVYCAGLMAEYRVHQCGSVSTRSRAAFLIDCLRNALEVGDWWAARGQLERKQQQAVLGVLDMVANASLALGDRSLFDQACVAVTLRKYQCPPEWPLAKRTAIGIFGYRPSLTAAHYLRRCRAAFRRQSA